MSSTTGVEPRDDDPPAGQPRLADLLDLLGYTDDERLTICHQPPGGDFTGRNVCASGAEHEAARWADTCNVWFTANAVAPPRDYRGRGAAAHVTRWAAVYADLDVKPGGLPGLKAARAVIDAVSEMLGQHPVAVIHSGHGLQPLWALDPEDEATDLAADPGRLTVARALMRRFGRLVAHAAATLVAEEHRGDVDTVFDLARVLRVPGTVNHKAEPVPTSVELTGGSLLTVKELADQLDAYGARELPGDRDGLGEIVSDPEGWGWTAGGCAYGVKAITSWAEAAPENGRHPWLINCAVRLAAMHRWGCLTENDHRRAVGILARRMTELCEQGIGGDVRNVAPGEIADALAWGQVKAASKANEALGSEIGRHTHNAAPATTTAPAPATIAIPDFPWDARPILRHIHTFARSRRVAPYSLLGNVLARTAAMISVRYVFPRLTGRLGTLDLAVAAVGYSGGGKGTVHGAGAEVIDWSTWRDPISEQPLRRIGLGSGEGIAHQYAKRTRSGEHQRLRESVLFDCPEVDRLAALASRQGTTLTAVLRTAWSGEDLGSAFVDPQKALDVPERSYRFVLILGVQPGRAEPLLDQAAIDGGTPQRFLWLPTIDPEAPDELPPEPPAAKIKLPGVPIRQTEIAVCAAAREEIGRAATARVRGHRGDDIDGHALYTQLKVSAVLAALDGHVGTDGVTADDWSLAAQIMAVSNATRAAVQAELASAVSSRNIARGKAEGEREVAKTDTITAAEIARGSRGVLRYLAKHPGKWVAGSAVRKSLDKPLRPHFAKALEALIATGQVEVQGTEYHGQSGVKIREKT